MWWFLKKLCGESKVEQYRCGNISKLTKNLVNSNVVQELQKAMHDNKSFRSELFSLWNDKTDVVGVVFLVTHFINCDYSMLEIIAYSKHGYKVSQTMLSFKSADELFEWFQKEDTPQKCKQTLLELYEIVKHPD